ARSATPGAAAQHAPRRARARPPDRRRSARACRRRRRRAPPATARRRGRRANPPAHPRRKWRDATGSDTLPVVSAPEEVWIPLVDEPIGTIVNRIQEEDPTITALVDSPRRILAFRTF